MVVVVGSRTCSKNQRPQPTNFPGAGSNKLVCQEESAHSCHSLLNTRQWSSRGLPVVQAVAAASGLECQENHSQKMCLDIQSFIKRELRDCCQVLAATNEAAMDNFRKVWEAQLEADIARRPDLAQQFSILTTQVHSLHAPVNRIALQHAECKQSFDAVLRVLEPFVANVSACKQCCARGVHASETSAGLLQGSPMSSPCANAGSTGGCATKTMVCQHDAPQPPEGREVLLAWHHVTHPAPNTIETQSSAGDNASSAKMKSCSGGLAARESGVGDGQLRQPSQPSSRAASPGCASPCRYVTFRAADSKEWQPLAAINVDISPRVKALEAALAVMQQQEQERIYGLRREIGELNKSSRRRAMVMAA